MIKLLQLIFTLLTKLYHNQGEIMQGLTDLQTQVTALTTAVGGIKTLVSGLQSQITSLQATIAAGGDNDADVEAQAKAIAAQVSSLNAIVNPTPAA